jgi:hypothetical protein
MSKLERKVQRRLRRAIVDFLGMLALFWLTALALSSLHSQAYAISLPPLAAVAAQLAAPANTGWDFAAGSGRALSLPSEAPSIPPHSLVLLSIMVAGLAAFNLAFWRHLRRVYASQRRGVWGRD